LSTLVGTLLNDRYRLDAHVGAGGMSMVYRAFDTVLERPVAIKLMHREVAAHADQLERFRREARAVAQLNHPHIVTVIDAGEDQGVPYIVFEYVEGETLKERIRRTGRLAIPEAVAYAIEIARALECAHEGGIVHRDVKPQNVLVDPEGRAKITDFGIARTLSEEGLTADGRVLGTTDYVSPEQALGHPVTGQSDLYSLGIVLFEMLTGSVPFGGENQVAVAMRHVREQVPDVQTRRPEVSSALAAVVDRATSKSLERRYPDADTMLGDLEEALAIETARAGQATGEATAVLQTLPARARRRLPLRMRHGRLAALVLVPALLVAAAVVVAVVVSRTHSGTGGESNVPASPQLSAISLSQNAAHDYNPYDPSGVGTQHPETVALAVDNDPGTHWDTETYQGATLNGKPGVGLYVDASPGVAARQMVVQTPTPGFQAQVWVAPGDRKPPRLLPAGSALSAGGWKQVDVSGGQPITVGSKQRIPLDTAGQPFRYYLLWITKLPPNGDKASISEIGLYR
jgi:serine/threonine-protein kinase